MFSASTFNTICFIWIILAMLLVPVLLKVTQPYGKHTKANWGPMINNRLAWFLMELPALLVFFYFLGTGANIGGKMVWIAASLWGLHYVHRAILFPFLIHTKGKKMPLIIMLFAVFFNTINGFLNGYWLANFSPVGELSLLGNMRIGLGVIVFLAGFVINKYHDSLLIKLRNNGEPGYKIPYGGLFQYVSCPNFLGELISWMGFLLVTMSLPALSFLIWGMANLVTRALDHHKWYLIHFQEYPKKRKAIFPFIL